MQCNIVTSFFSSQVDEHGALFVADTGNHRIRRISPDGIVTTIAGSGALGYCDGPGSLARFASPCVVIVSDSGMLYTSEHGCNVIRAIIQVRMSYVYVSFSTGVMLTCIGCL